MPRAAEPAVPQSRPSPTGPTLGAGNGSPGLPVVRRTESAPPGGPSRDDAPDSALFGGRQTRRPLCHFSRAMSVQSWSDRPSRTAPSSTNSGRRHHFRKRTDGHQRQAGPFSVVSMEIETYIVTRNALHGVCRIAAGRAAARADRAHSACGPCPGGFATRSHSRGSDPERRCRRRREAARPSTAGPSGDLADALSVTATGLSHVYRDVFGPRPEPYRWRLMRRQRGVSLRCTRSATPALRAFAPDEEPILWPEHFDIAITVGRT